MHRIWVQKDTLQESRGSWSTTEKVCIAIIVFLFSENTKIGLDLRNVKFRTKSAQHLVNSKAVLGLKFSDTTRVSRHLYLPEFIPSTGTDIHFDNTNIQPKPFI